MGTSSRETTQHQWWTAFMSLLARQTDINQHVQSALQQTMRPLMGVIAGNIYVGPPAPVPEGLEHCPLTNLSGQKCLQWLWLWHGAASPLFNSPPNNPHASSQQHSKVAIKKKDCWHCLSDEVCPNKRQDFATQSSPARAASDAEDWRKTHGRWKEKKSAWGKAGRSEAADPGASYYKQWTLWNIRQCGLFDSSSSARQILCPAGGPKRPNQVPGSVEDLILDLKEHLGDPALLVEPQPQLQSEDEDYYGGYDEFNNSASI